jgi:hypothetical protein
MQGVCPWAIFECSLKKRGRRTGRIYTPGFTGKWLKAINEKIKLALKEGLE